MRSTRGVHFSQDTSQKVSGGDAYRGEAARGELPSVYGHQVRPQLSKRTDLGFRDGHDQVPFGSEGLLGTTNMAWRDGDKQKRYPPATKKSRGHKLGKLPEQQPTSTWSSGKADASYQLLGERSSLLQNSRLSSSDESSDDEEEEESFTRRHRKPLQPKMPMFDGKSNEWGPFLFQFRKMAKIGRWTEKEKRDCLCGKAITHIDTKPKYFRTSHESLKNLLKQRYGMTELPVTARRQFSSMKQEEGGFCWSDDRKDRGRIPRHARGDIASSGDRSFLSWMQRQERSICSLRKEAGDAMQTSRGDERRSCQP